MEGLELRWIELERPESVVSVGKGTHLGEGLVSSGHGALRRAVSAVVSINGQAERLPAAATLSKDSTGGTIRLELVPPVPLPPSLRSLQVTIARESDGEECALAFAASDGRPVWKIDWEVEPEDSPLASLFRGATSVLSSGLPRDALLPGRIVDYVAVLQASSSLNVVERIPATDHLDCSFPLSLSNLLTELPDPPTAVFAIAPRAPVASSFTLCSVASVGCSSAEPATIVVVLTRTLGPSEAVRLAGWCAELREREPAALSTLAEQLITQAYCPFLVSPAVSPLVDSARALVPLGLVRTRIVHPWRESDSITVTTGSGGGYLRSPSFPLGQTLGLCGVHILVRLVEAALAEQRVLLVSSCPSALSAACDAAMTLVYPLCIEVPVSPIVPSSSVDELLRAPVPYLFGVLRPTFESKVAPSSAETDLEHTLVLDIDHQVVLRSGGGEICFPPATRATLIGNLSSLGKEAHDGPIRAAFSMALQDILAGYGAGAWFAKQVPDWRPRLVDDLAASMGETELPTSHLRQAMFQSMAMQQFLQKHCHNTREGGPLFVSVHEGLCLPAVPSFPDEPAKSVLQRADALASSLEIQPFLRAQGDPSLLPKLFVDLDHASRAPHCAVEVEFARGANRLAGVKLAAIHKRFHVSACIELSRRISSEGGQRFLAALLDCLDMIEDPADSPWVIQTPPTWRSLDSADVAIHYKHCPWLENDDTGLSNAMDTILAGAVSPAQLPLRRIPSFSELMHPSTVLEQLKTASVARNELVSRFQVHLLRASGRLLPPPTLTESEHSSSWISHQSFAPQERIRGVGSETPPPLPDRESSPVDGARRAKAVAVSSTAFLTSLAKHRKASSSSRLSLSAERGAASTYSLCPARPTAALGIALLPDDVNPCILPWDALHRLDRLAQAALTGFQLQSDGMGALGLAQALWCFVSRSPATGVPATLLHLCLNHPMFEEMCFWHALVGFSCVCRQGLGGKRGTAPVRALQETLSKMDWVATTSRRDELEWRRKKEALVLHATARWRIPHDVRSLLYREHRLGVGDAPSTPLAAHTRAATPPATPGDALFESVSRPDVDEFVPPGILTGPSELPPLDAAVTMPPSPAGTTSLFRHRSSEHGAFASASSAHHRVTELKSVVLRASSSRAPECTALAVNPGESLVVGGALDGSVSVWELGEWPSFHHRPVLKLHRHMVSSVHISSSSVVISAANDGSIVLATKSRDKWSATARLGGHAADKTAPGQGVVATDLVSLTAADTTEKRGEMCDSLLVTAGGKGVVCLHQIPDASSLTSSGLLGSLSLLRARPPVAQLVGHAQESTVGVVRFGGRRAGLSIASGARNGRVVVWDAATSAISNVYMHRSPTTDLCWADEAFSVDPSTGSLVSLAVACLDGHVSLLDLRARAQAALLCPAGEPGTPVWKIRSRNNWDLICACEDGIVRRMDARYPLRPVTELGGHFAAATCIDADETKFVTGSSDTTLRLFSYSSERSAAVGAGHVAQVSQVVLRSRALYSSSWDGDIRVWFLDPRSVRLE
jgi:WD40 repeat protein